MNEDLQILNYNNIHTLIMNILEYIQDINERNLDHQELGPAAAASSNSEPGQAQPSLPSEPGQAQPSLLAVNSFYSSVHGSSSSSSASSENEPGAPSKP